MWGAREISRNADRPSRLRKPPSFFASFSKTRLFFSKLFQRFLWRFCGISKACKVSKPSSVPSKLFAPKSGPQRRHKPGRAPWNGLKNNIAPIVFLGNRNRNHFSLSGRRASGDFPPSHVITRGIAHARNPIEGRQGYAFGRRGRRLARRAIRHHAAWQEASCRDLLGGMGAAFEGSELPAACWPRLPLEEDDLPDRDPSQGRDADL